MADESPQPQPREAITWLTCFLDLAPDVHDRAAEFWAAATASTLSPARGEHGEFRTLRPVDGDPYLRVQRLGREPSGLHLELHAHDHEALARRVVGLGAEEVARLDDVVVLRSPGGLAFCTVPAGETVLSSAIDWGGHTSRMDQVCLDLPAGPHAAEWVFWAGVLGERLERSSDRTEFTNIRRAPHLPLRLLLQEVGHDGVAGAHADFATTDREAEVARLERLGARVEGPGDGWTVLVDPAGMRFCVTDRRPITPGRPPRAEPA